MRRTLVLICALACGAAAVLPAGAGVRDSAPPGATARCRDGGYSSSTHHSGTCSHHGGVAAWLDGSTSGVGASAPSVAVGATVYLAKRTRTSGCRLGALPDRRCSPGAFYRGLTASVLCSSSFRTSAIRHVTDATRHAVEVEYGLLPRSYGRTLEIDHIVPLELGGSNDVANLYPEKAELPAGAPGYHAKDRLENRAHALVCSGARSLRTAQKAIAANWERLYERVFGGPAER